MASTLITVNVTQKDSTVYEEPIEFLLSTQFFKSVEDRTGSTRILLYDPQKSIVVVYIVQETVAQILAVSPNLISLTSITIDSIPNAGQILLNALDSILQAVTEDGNSKIYYNNGDVNTVLNREIVVSESLSAIQTLVDNALNPPDVDTFLTLNDTPSSYSGETGKSVIVNAGETALEFVSLATSNWQAVMDVGSTATGLTTLVNVSTTNDILMSGDDTTLTATTALLLDSALGTVTLSGNTTLISSGINDLTIQSLGGSADIVLTSGQDLNITVAGVMNVSGLTAFASDAAAGVGGLVTGDLYRNTAGADDVVGIKA